MPVHRHLHDKLGSVYAFRSELDLWWGSRSRRLAGEAPEENAGHGHDTAGEMTRRTNRRRLAWWAVAALVLVLTGAGIWRANTASTDLRNLLAGAQFQRLTDFDGAEQAAAVSRDGSLVAFLADRGGTMDAWVTRVGSGDFRNLTRGTAGELVNPSIRTLGFSADAKSVLVWARQLDGSHSEDISIWAAPSAGGGGLQPYLAKAAEFDWSHDGQRLVYHTTGPGDPLFVREPNHATDRMIFVGTAGVHCHFPVWSPDDAYIYFAQGVPPDEWDIWRIRPTGGVPERITFHRSRVTHPVLLDTHTLLYLATDRDGSGPWLYAMDTERRVAVRVSSGIERYTSLAASANGARLVVTTATPRASLWRVPIQTELVKESGASRIALPNGNALSPRLGPGYVVYVATKGTREGVWKLAHGAVTQLWSAPSVQVIAAPTIAPDGRRIAFSVKEGAQTGLYVMNADGTGARVLSHALDLRGTLAWTPDGQALVSAVTHEGAPHLFRIPTNGDPPSLLVSEYSINPVWSPDGRFLVYSGPDVGTTFPLRAAAADGRAYPLPSLILTRGARVGFVNGARNLVILRGEIERKNFWLVDLDTGAERQLTDLSREFTIRDFDISADGSEIVFDRVQESSDIVLIDRTA
jgi:Tol biopolymer transport system component